MHKVIIYLCLAIVSLCPNPLSAQTMDRKVFSNGGGEGLNGIYVYQYTFGEPIVGTVNSAGTILTKGFHQPLDISLLPLSIIGPEAFLRSDAVQIQWAANIAVGEGVLILERSADGQNFEAIHEVAAQGIAGEIHHYTFDDQSVVPQKGFRFWYRVQLLSYAGEIRQSETVSILISGSSVADWRIFPNPNNGNFSISYYLAADSEMQCRLLNGLGQSVWAQDFQWSRGYNELDIGLPALPRGSYFLVIQSPQQSWSKTIVLH